MPKGTRVSRGCRCWFFRLCLGWFAFGMRALVAIWLLAGVSQALSQPAERTVAATVDEMPIYTQSVELAVERVVGEQAISAEGRQHLAGELLELLVQRRLALAWLEASSLGASEDDLDLAMARLERALSEQQLTLADYLTQSGLSEAELRERYTWEIGWGRFLERQMTDENLASYFEHYRRQFDGTELRVAQVLLVPAVAPGEAGHAAARDATLAEATALREQILAGELSFAEAAQEHSAAPSAREGGEQGWIARYEPMPESFSAAAFELAEGEISEPVVSGFGIHLIHCQQVKAGQRTWQECREQLVPAVEQYLLENVANRQRPNSVVEYTGEVPYGGE